MNDYPRSIRRVVFAVAAFAMSALTVSLAVIAPAQTGPASGEPRMLATAPNAITRSLDESPAPHRVADGSRTPCVL